MKEVRTTIDSGQTKIFPAGIRVYEIFEAEDIGYEKHPVIGASVNNKLCSLSYKITVNSHLMPIMTNSTAGARIYRSSLSFLLAYVIQRYLPDENISISHSLGDGFFYDKENGCITKDQVNMIEEEMHKLIKQNLAITRIVVGYKEALDILSSQSFLETTKLLSYRNENKIAMYKMGDYVDLAHTPLAPNTGMLRYFTIMPYKNGLLLRYPRSIKPDTVNEFKDNPLLFNAYQEHKKWGNILGINSVGALNELNHNKKRLQEFIQVTEALQDKKIAEIADKIYASENEKKVVLIAGPSSSGKTTFSKKLAIQLRVLGYKPRTVSLDDFFVNRENTPKDADGNYDFECIEAIDTKLLNQNILTLLDGKEVEIPSFNFKIGQREYLGKHFLCLEPQSILILEGIHGLNDQLTKEIDSKAKFKIYISALTQLNLDSNNRIPTTDNRLLRRMVRDSQFRGHSALATLQMWPSVRRGEDKNIFPFQNNADIAFNSALDYELAVLKIFAESLLKTVKPDVEEYSEAVRLQNFLNNFVPIPTSYIPEYSIVREFIGGSGFKY